MCHLLTDTDIHSQFSGGTSSDHRHLAMTYYRRFNRDLYTCIPTGRAVITHCSRSLGSSVHCRISKCQVVPRHDMQAYGGNWNRTPLSLGIGWKPRPGGFTPPPTEQEVDWDPTSTFKLGKRNTVTYCNWQDHGNPIGSQRFQKFPPPKSCMNFLPSPSYMISQSYPLRFIILTRV